MKQNKQIICNKYHLNFRLAILLVAGLLLLRPLHGRAKSNVGGSVPSVAKTTAQLQQSKLLFTENKGQVADRAGKPRPDILFTAHNGGTNIFLTSTGIHYQFTHIIYPEGYEQDGTKVTDPNLQANLEKQIQELTHHFSLELAGANPHPSIRKENKNRAIENFYLPQCPSGITDVATYEKVVYENVYPNIDWVVYSNGNHMKYDFIVRPGGNTAQIKLRIKDAGGISITEAGELLMTTSLGEIREQAPVSYAKGNKIATRFQMNADGSIGFAVAAMPAGATLTIDPTVSWSTYYGNTGSETPGTLGSPSCTTDASGNIYIGGGTTSTTGIALSGYQSSLGGTAGASDGYLAKFDATGALLWATYYGDIGTDYIHACATDVAGNVYVAGVSTGTGASSALATAGTFQPSTVGGSADMFIVKFNSSGGRIWGTYYGLGSDAEWPFSCAVDAVGNMYVVGYASGTVIPIGNDASTGAYQTTAGGGVDGLVIKLDATGNRSWATLYGGAGTDEFRACAVDASGNLYAAGYTAAAGLAIGTTFQTTIGGGTDALLVKFNTSTGMPSWATYYGGSGTDEAFGCATDATSVYMTGFTSSTNGIATTTGAIQSALSGTNDAFAVRLDIATGATRTWGTYYGGTGADQGNACVADGNGNLYIAGTTASATQINSGGFQTTNGGGATDAMILKIGPSGSLVWGSYFGNTGAETGTSMAASSGSIYMTGNTTSTTGISSSGAVHQPAFGGGTSDAYLIKLQDAIPLSITTGTLSNTTFCAGKTVKVPYGVTGVFTAGNLFTAQLSDASGSFAGAVTIGTLTGISADTVSAIIPATAAGGTGYRIRVIGSNPADTGSNNGTNLIIYAAAPVITINDTICVNQLPFAWNGKTITTPGIAVATDTLPNVHGCDSIITLNLVTKALPALPAAFTDSSISVCQGQVNVLYKVPNDTAVTYTWSYSGNGTTLTGTGDSIKASFGNTATSGTLQVTASAINGCGVSAVRTVAVTVIALPAQPAAFITSQATVCQNQADVIYTIPNDTSVTYTWSYTGVGTSIAGTSDSVQVSYSDTAIGGILQVTAINGCGTSAARTVVVTVNTTPVLSISSNMFICTGSGTSLIASGAATYSWSPSASLSSATNDSVYATPGNTTTYTITGTTNGCADSITSTVAVNPLPKDTLIVYAPFVVCANSTLLMQATIDTGYNYQWQLNGTDIAGATSAFYNATAGGTYAVRITSTAGCTIFTRQVPISASPAPTPVISYAGNGQLCATAGFPLYQWYQDGIAITGDTGTCITPSTGGDYTVSVTNGTGCSATSPAMYLNTGISTIIPESVKLYPNPATTIVNINAPQSVNISLHTIDGRQLLYQQDAKAIDISKLPNAVYLIKVYDKTNNIIKIEKLVKTGW